MEARDNTAARHRGNLADCDQGEARVWRLVSEGLKADCRDSFKCYRALSLLRRTLTLRRCPRRTGTTSMVPTFSERARGPEMDTRSNTVVVVSTRDRTFRPGGGDNGGVAGNDCWSGTGPSCPRSTARRFDSSGRGSPVQSVGSRIRGRRHTKALADQEPVNGWPAGRRRWQQSPVRCVHVRRWLGGGGDHEQRAYLLRA